MNIHVDSPRLSPKYNEQSSQLAMQKLHEYYSNASTVIDAVPAIRSPEHSGKVVPKLLERIHTKNNIGLSALEALINSLGLVPVTKPKSGKTKVVMLIISEGNDVRAKKEADVLLDAGYEVVFIGRKNGLKSPEVGMDGRHKIIRVPTITNATSLRDVVRKHKSYFSFMERRLAQFLAFIFQITNFSLVGKNVAPAAFVPHHIRFSKKLEIVSTTNRAKAVEKRSWLLLVNSILLKTLSLSVKNIFLALVFPLFLLLKLIEFPFNMLDKSSAFLDERAAKSWSSITQTKKSIGIIRSLGNIFIAKLVGIAKFALSTLPRKLIGGITNAIVWPFVKIRNRTIDYLTPRTHQIFTLFSYFFYYLETKAEVIKQNPGAVHSHDLYMLQATVKSAKAVHAKSVYDAHELETGRHKGVAPRVQNNIKNQEIKYGKQADGVITVSESIVEIMQSNLERDDIIIVYNSPILTHPPVLPEDNIRSELNLPNDTPLALFVGKLYNIHLHDHRINNMIEALAYIPEMHLAILGAKSTNAVNEITAWAERYFVSDRVHLVDPVPYEYLLDYITTADLGINPMENKCLNTNYSMPNKVFEMSLAGIPVAQSNLKDSVRYLARYNLGVTMDPLDAKDMARAMMEVYSNRHEMRQSPQALQALRNEFGWTAQGDKLLTMYEHICAP